MTENGADLAATLVPFILDHHLRLIRAIDLFLMGHETSVRRRVEVVMREGAHNFLIMMGPSSSRRQSVLPRSLALQSPTPNFLIALIFVGGKDGGLGLSTDSSCCSVLTVDSLPKYGGRGL